jgi:hypothetical protein
MLARREHRDDIAEGFQRLCDLLARNLTVAMWAWTRKAK